MPSPTRLALLVWSAATLGSGCAEHHAMRVVEQAVTADERGDRILAARGYREAIRLDPAVRGAYQNLSLLAAQAGRTKDALAFARLEVEHHPGALAARHNLAILLAREGRPGDVEAVLTPADLASSAGLMLLAQAARAAGDEALASETLRRIIAAPVDGVEVVGQLLLATRARRALAWRAARAGRWPEAGRELTAIAPMRTEADDHLHALVHHAAARAALGRGDLPAARDALNEAARLLADATPPDLLLDRALVLAHLGEPAQALEAIESILVANPNHARALALQDTLTQL